MTPEPAFGMQGRLKEMPHETYHSKPPHRVFNLPGLVSSALTDMYCFGWCW